jgi:hypothetical protein
MIQAAERACGLPHVSCLIEKALSQHGHRGNSVWWECQTCERIMMPVLMGAMERPEKVLAEAWWPRMCDEVEESEELLLAMGNLAECSRPRRSSSKSTRRLLGAEAERIQRQVLGMRRRILGEEHADSETLTSANLAKSLSNQGKCADAERIDSENLN